LKRWRDAEAGPTTTLAKVPVDWQETKVRVEAELAATDTEVKRWRDAAAATTTTFAKAQAEWQQTEARLEAKLAATNADVVTKDSELKRWRDGELTSKRVIDVDTGAVDSTVVEVASETDHPSKRARRTQDERPSTLSLLADWNARAVQVKTEAHERASRLEDELEDAKDATLCTLCLEKPRDVVFPGCGHFLSCGDCAEALLARHGGTRNKTQAPCPNCREHIKKMLSCVVVRLCR